MRISGRLESSVTVCGRGNVLSEIGVCSVVALGVGMFIGCKEQFRRIGLAQNRHADAGSERTVLKEFRCSGFQIAPLKYRDRPRSRSAWTVVSSKIARISCAAPSGTSAISSGCVFASVSQTVKMSVEG